MWVVIGASPLAIGIAEVLSTHAATTLANTTPAAGPFLWRRLDLATGEGLAPALRAVHRLVIVLDEPGPVTGLLGVLRPGLVPRSVVVLRQGDDQPDLLQRLDDPAVLRVGPVWGPHEPLVAAWAARIHAGRRVWLADPGPIPALPVGHVAEAARAVAERPGRRWILGASEPTSLPALASSLARGLGQPLSSVRVPLSLAAWRESVPAARLRRWLDTPVMSTDTPGWSAPHHAGPPDWLDDTSRWRNNR